MSQVSNLRWRSTFLLLVLLAGSLPACQPQAVETERTFDDALLLALASHEQLDLDRSATSMRGQGSLLALVPATAPKGKNPHWQMASWYEDMALQLDEEQGPMFDYAVEKAEEHNQLAVDLDKAREWRAGRGRGFQRAMRGLARAPLQVARAVGIGVRETFRFAKMVVIMAVDQVPQLARDYVQRKIRELGGLLQGRIDLAWDKIADRVGLPFASWLRSRIDPAFVRLRNRIVARARRKEVQQVGPALDPAAEAAAAERASRAEGYEQAGSMAATCQWPFLWNYTGSTFETTSIPVQVKVDLTENTLSYSFEYQGYYEDFKKCDYSLRVEGAGVFQEEDPWFQGTEKATAQESCYILNLGTGEKIPAGDTASVQEAEIAGTIHDDLRTLSLCYAAPLGGINAMMAGGKAALLENGWCTPCTLAPP